MKFLEKDHQDDKKLCFKSAVKRRDPILVGSIEKMSRLTDISDLNGLKRQHHFYSFFICKSILDGWVWVPLITYLATLSKVSKKRLALIMCYLLDIDLALFSLFLLWEVKLNKS